MPEYFVTPQIYALIPYIPEILSNGDSIKQLLARSRYLLYKRKHEWTSNQKERAMILFKLYPDIEHAYNLSQELAHIFDYRGKKIYATTKLALWHEKVAQSGYKAFNGSRQKPVEQKLK